MMESYFETLANEELARDQAQMLSKLTDFAINLQEEKKERLSI